MGVARRNNKGPGTRDICELLTGGKEKTLEESKGMMKVEEKVGKEEEEGYSRLSKAQASFTTFDPMINEKECCGNCTRRSSISSRKVVKLLV